MQIGTPRSNKTEREFLSAGNPDSAGKVRELPVVTAVPEPAYPMSECTRVESLIFDEPAE